MGRKLVLGDVHGNYKALKQVLERSKFDYEKDTLILLGDLVDGFPDSYKVVIELLKIKNIVFVRGNHDEWFIQFMNKGSSPNIWLHQGGAATLTSYNKNLNQDKLESGSVIDDCEEDLSEVMIPVTHQHFFNNSVPYYEHHSMLFVHGGFDDMKPIEKQKPRRLMWDRTIIQVAKNRPIKQYDKVFIGHTALTYNDYKPVILNNLYCLDNGAGWEGKLTLMDINTEEYWQSDLFEGHDDYEGR